MNSQPKKYSVVGMYPTITLAEAAITMLDKGKFPVNQISILATDIVSEKDVAGFVTTQDIALQGARAGAWFGGIFGILAGAAFLAVPGFGTLVAAGPIVAMILGGLEGSVAGATVVGLLGGMAGLGISKRHIVKYADELKGGKYIVVVHGTSNEVARAHSILENTDSEELNLHVDTNRISASAAQM